MEGQLNPFVIFNELQNPTSLFPLAEAFVISH